MSKRPKPQPSRNHPAAEPNLLHSPADELAGAKNLARRILLASRLNVPKTGWYLRQLFGNSTTISGETAKIQPRLSLDYLVWPGGCGLKVIRFNG